jgi:hypothetical protein
MVRYRRLADADIAANKARHDLLSRLPHEDWCRMAAPGEFDGFAPRCECLTREVLEALTFNEGDQ